MSLLQRGRKALLSLVLMGVLVLTVACGTAAPPDRAALPQGSNQSQNSYAQIERGNSTNGQEFGTWVVQTSRGLVQDAYVRDNNKLGVVISPQVRPNEVRPLAKSLAQGFRKNFPDRDLTVLVYAPDKKLILTARYDNQTKQVEYQ